MRQRPLRRAALQRVQHALCARLPAAAVCGKPFSAGFEAQARALYEQRSAWPSPSPSAVRNVPGLVSLVAARPRSARANTSNAAPSSSRCSLPPHCARPRPQCGAPPPERDRPHQAGQRRAPQGTQLRGYHGRAPVRCSHARRRRAPRWRGRRRAPRCPLGRRPLRRVSGAPFRSWRRTGRRAAPATWTPPRPWRTGPARGCSTSGPCGWAGPAKSRPARLGAALARGFGSPGATPTERGQSETLLKRRAAGHAACVRALPTTLRRPPAGKKQHDLVGCRGPWQAHQRVRRVVLGQHEQPHDGVVLDPEVLRLLAQGTRARPQQGRAPARQDIAGVRAAAAHCCTRAWHPPPRG